METCLLLDNKVTHGGVRAKVSCGTTLHKLIQQIVGILQRKFLWKTTSVVRVLLVL